MSLVAPVEDGKIVTGNTSATENTNKTTGTKEASGSTLDKEAFLQLLVAQMKYQDPLEPTSNTEYVSQYAQFSQVESMQNMSSSMDLQRASTLVGQNVYVQTTTSTGESKYVQGIVDYVSFEGGKAYVYINENRYSLEEVESIVDQDYFEAYNLATDLVTGINKLPNINVLDLSDGETVDKLNEIYSNMTDYQKTFVAKEKAEVLQLYVERIAQLRKLAEESEEPESPEAVETPETEENSTDTEIA